MRKEKCELCGNRIDPRYIERHHVVPTQVTEKAGLPESQTFKLCSDCHREIQEWYSLKVSDMTYDPKIKRFRNRSWLEMVKEYESAFNSFMKYWEKQPKLL